MNNWTITLWTRYVVQNQLNTFLWALLTGLHFQGPGSFESLSWWHSDMPLFPQDFAEKNRWKSGLLFLERQNATKNSKIHQQIHKMEVATYLPHCKTANAWSRVLVRGQKCKRKSIAPNVWTPVPGTSICYQQSWPCENLGLSASPWMRVEQHPLLFRDATPGYAFKSMSTAGRALQRKAWKEHWRACFCVTTAFSDDDMICNVYS